MLLTEPPSIQTVTTSRDATRWFVLAVVSLAVSGVFSLVLVLGRVPLPAIAPLFDPTLAQRSLVVHVNLAMGVWFLACIAGLFCLLPGRSRWSFAPAAAWIALAGTALLAVSTFFRTATPIMSNYVPALDHPLFLVSLIVFVAGVLLNFVDRRMVLPGTATATGEIPVEAQYALRASAAVFMVALVTIVGALATQRSGMDALTYYDRLFWGGGHVFQTANILGMLGAWLILLHRLTGRPVVGTRWAVALFAVVVVPTLAGPWLTFGMRDASWFTRMMQYGIFPVVLVFTACGARALWTRRDRLDPTSLETPALVGLIASVVMTLAGFILGAMIVADTTLTPAHYHANIGAVTVAFMTVLMVLRAQPRAGSSWSPLARWQPVIYGTGQMLFVIGLAVAGTLGQAPRKTYGLEQHVLSSAERTGLMIVGAGGILALGGGAIFITLMARAALDARRP